MFSLSTKCNSGSFFVVEKSTTPIAKGVFIEQVKITIYHHPKFASMSEIFRTVLAAKLGSTEISSSVESF
jgi:hypothetical protein